MDDYTKLPLLVAIGVSSLTITCTTILDSGADVNVISVEAYNNLKIQDLMSP